MMDAPKRCPFCGHVPEVEHIADWSEYGVRCENRRCPATPRVYSQTRERAIEIWNIRHEDA
jgi:hypothetical protein